MSLNSGGLFEVWARRGRSLSGGARSLQKTGVQYYALCDTSNIHEEVEMEFELRNTRRGWGLAQSSKRRRLYCDDVVFIF